MPGILPHYDIDDKKLNEAADRERKARVGLLNAYWDYYNGNHRKPLKANAKDNVILNVSGLAIDKAVSMFAHKRPTVELPGGAQREPGPEGFLVVQKTMEQQALDNFLEANEFEALLADMALSGFVSGHVFLRLFEDKPLPRLALLDPRKVQIFWDSANIHRVLFFRLTWQPDGSEKTRIQDIVPNWLLAGRTEAPTGPVVIDPENADAAIQPLDQWTILEYESKAMSSKFEPVGRDPWPFPFAPIIHWKNKYAPHEVYGQSDLKHADLNDAINFIASNTARIIKYHAHPRSYVTGADASQIKATSVDGLFELPAGAQVGNIEMQSDLTSSLNMLELLMTAFYNQMRVVNLSTQKDKLGQITNFGVRMVYKDMLDMIAGKWSIYGKGLAEALLRALLMMGMEVERPQIRPADPLPTNRKELVDTIKVEQELGITSKQSLAEDLGREYEVEQERQAEEAGKATDGVAQALIRLGEAGRLP